MKIFLIQREAEKRSKILLIKKTSYSIKSEQENPNSENNCLINYC